VVEVADSEVGGAVGTVKVKKDGERTVDRVGGTSVLELLPVTGDTGVEEVLLNIEDVTTDADVKVVGIMMEETPDGKVWVETNIHETVERFTEV
jgi:hypothetical protein